MPNPVQKNRFDKDKPVPVMDAYKVLREQHIDSILFMKIGDFFEAFDGDAREAADILGLRIQTLRINDREVAMVGFPCRMAEKYVAQLIKAGRRVALAEPTHGTD